jgi:hypothetical protein
MELELMPQHTHPLLAEAAVCISQYAQNLNRPCTIWKPKLFIDGNKWCAIYGDNLMEGVAAFGDSPSDAMCEFDRAWYEKLASETKLGA